MKILTIGNSFSNNACHFLPEIFADGGVPLTIGRACIGGCSLERHWNNAETDERIYGDTYNGTKTLREMLEADSWDVVTIQQASHFSWNRDTFYPFADKLVEFVKQYTPNAEIIVHETWAYRTDNGRLDEFGITQAEMFERLKANYLELAGKYGLRIFPTGEALRIMQEETADATGEITRNPDGPSHANALGEFIGGLVWYTVLTGNDIDKITYIPEGVDEKYVVAAKKSAKAAVEMYNK
ncbi:MAG: DUF4886 domain-containing protein [Clostridiales bacterium]|nr:DUF4886 domain-containing protein [Clostridiales bacterium]